MFDYWDQVNKDIITPLTEAFRVKDCFLRRDKIYIPLTDSIASPWIHAKIRTDTNCNRYQMVYHGIYGFIPNKCFSCWKVVQRPRNIDELFQICQYQKEMRVPAKCGIETRMHVPGNYGAYWYNATKEQGLDRLDIVRKDFPDIPAILKRGCTEFEMSHGPSDRWVQHSHLVEFEQVLDEIFVEIWRHDTSSVREVTDIPHPWFVANTIKRRWVEFAFEHGDQLYKLFTKGTPLMKPVITYEREMETGCQVDKLIKLAK